MKSNSWRRMIAQPCSASPKDEVKKLQFGVISSGSCCCPWGRGTTVHFSGPLISTTWTFNLFSGAGWCVARVCGGSDFSALIWAITWWSTFASGIPHFLYQNWPFLVLLKVSPCLSVSHVARQREQILHEKLLYNLWPRAETADLTKQWMLPGNFWITLRKSKTES